MTHHPPPVQRIHSHERRQPMSSPKTHHTGRRGWPKSPHLAEVAVAYLDTEYDGGSREEREEEQPRVCVACTVDGLVKEGGCERGLCCLEG